MALRKQGYFPEIPITTRPRLAREADQLVPSPVHRLHGDVEAQLSRASHRSDYSIAENTMDDGEEKFPGWLRFGLLAVPTFVLWGGAAIVLRAFA